MLNHIFGHLGLIGMPNHSFPLLNLPRELRDRVYSLVFKTSPLPRDQIVIRYTYFPASKDFPATHTEFTSVEHEFDCSLINLQLTCHQVYKEANPLFYKHLQVDLDTSSCDDAHAAEQLLARRHEHYRSGAQILSTDEIDPGPLALFSNLKLVLFDHVPVYGVVVTTSTLNDLVRQITTPESDADTGVFHLNLERAGAACETTGAECWFLLIHEWIDDWDDGDWEGLPASSLARYDPSTKEISLSKKPKDLNRRQTRDGAWLPYKVVQYHEIDSAQGNLLLRVEIK